MHEMKTINSPAWQNNLCFAADAGNHAVVRPSLFSSFFCRRWSPCPFPSCPWKLPPAPFFLSSRLRIRPSQMIQR